MADPLQQPEFAGELAAARELVPSALEALVAFMHTRQLEVVGTELERERQVGDLVLHGRLDLLVRRGPVSAVLDLKWTRSERRYRSEEHTSELQSLMRISYAVFCLKKKNNQRQSITQTHQT